MLKGIDPLLHPELLFALAKMGHGDKVAIVDNNYPAYQAGVPVLRLDGVDMIEATESVLTLLPVDTFIDRPITVMREESANEAAPIGLQFIDLVSQVEDRPVGAELVDRFTFYELAKSCVAIIATSESRPYGCAVITKGVC